MNLSQVEQKTTTSNQLSQIQSLTDAVLFQLANVLSFAELDPQMAEEVVNLVSRSQNATPTATHIATTNVNVQMFTFTLASAYLNWNAYMFWVLLFDGFYTIYNFSQGVDQLKL